MDFNFNFGDTYGMSNGFSFKDLTPYAILAITLYYNYWKEQKNKKRDRKYKLEYLNIMIINSVNVGNKQLKSLKDYVDSFNKDTYEIKVMPIFYDLDLKRMVEFQNHSEYYRAYCDYFTANTETATKYNNFFKYIGFLYEQMNLQQIRYERLGEVEQKLKDEFQLIIIQLNESLTTIRNDYFKVDKNSKISIELTKILNTKIFNNEKSDEIKSLNLLEFQDKILTILFKLLENELLEIDPDSKHKNMISRCFNLIHHLKFNAQEFKNQVAKNYEKYEIVYNSLLADSNELNEKLTAK